MEFPKILLILGFTFLAISVFVKIAFSQKQALYILLIAGVFIGLGSISIDPYLHSWDERFHALVAQNMLSNPFRPTLFREAPLEHINHDPWWGSHVWMHKGPWFSWQMALSMLIFGKNIIAMRLPAIFMIMLIVVSVYRSAKLYFPKAAFPIALIAVSQVFLYLLGSGRIGMDHNDLAFIAFISGSFWAWTEYLNKPNSKWWILIGIMAAFAILTKWFAGTLIFFLWGLYILLFEIKSGKSWISLIKAFGVCLLLVVPWFLYSYYKFPDVLLQEWELNGASHLFVQLDGHQTPWYFHFNIWYHYLLITTSFFVMGLIVFFTLKKGIAKKIALVSLVAIGLVMMVFSIAQTRMPAYTLILVAPAFYIASIGLHFLMDLLKKYSTVLIIAILIGCMYQFYIRFGEAAPYQGYVDHQIKVRDFYTDLKNKIPEKSIIYNTPHMEFVDVMFYTEKIAYGMVPSEVEIQITLDKGYEPILILDDRFTHENLKANEYLKGIKTFKATY